MAKGTRLPDDWQPTPELIEYAKSVGVTDTPRMASDFCDYWISKSGKDATKLDWNRTWMKWARTEGDKCREKAAREHRYQNRYQPQNDGFLANYEHTSTRAKRRYSEEDLPSKPVTLSQEEIEAAERGRRLFNLQRMN